MAHFGIIIRNNISPDLWRMILEEIYFGRKIIYLFS